MKNTAVIVLCMLVIAQTVSVKSDSLKIGYSPSWGTRMMKSSTIKLLFYPVGEDEGELLIRSNSKRVNFLNGVLGNGKGYEISGG